jgi:polysaccharide biosynthesis protein PslH
MRILVVAEEALLPPATGFRSAVSALVDHLRPSNEVRVVALRVPGQTDPTPPDTRLVDWHPASKLRDAARLARAISRGRPARADVHANAIRAALVEEMASFQPDVLHVSAGRLAALGPMLHRVPSLLSAFDAAHRNVEARAEAARGIRKILLRGEARRWKRYEQTDWHHFTRVTVTNESDRAALTELDPRIRIQVVPLGIDVRSFIPEPGAVKDAKRIVFHGVLDYAPNIAAADFLIRRVWPRVHAARPDARLTIVGRDPLPELRTLAASAGVEVTGGVPDVRPWLTGSRVYACPMRNGTGSKNKVLEAMACGLPCVLTPLASRGIGGTPGAHMLEADTEEEFAAAVVRVLDDDDLAARIGAGGRSFVEEEHDWAAVARIHERLYEEIAGEMAAVRGERA